MNMKKLMLKMSAAIFTVCGLLLTGPHSLLAQYGGAVQPGQVLGEEAKKGVPVWIFILIALGLLLFILFFALRRKKNKPQ